MGANGRPQTGQTIRGDNQSIEFVALFQTHLTRSGLQKIKLIKHMTKTTGLNLDKSEINKEYTSIPSVIEQPFSCLSSYRSSSQARDPRSHRRPRCCKPIRRYISLNVYLKIVLENYEKCIGYR